MKREELKQAIYAGVLAGLLFLILEIILIPVFTENSPWTMPRMIAAVVMGKNVLPPAASFDLGIITVSLVVHLAMSALYSIILSLFIHLSNLPAATIVGFIYGLILYYLNFYLIGSIYPWFAESRNWIHILASLLFGGAAGFIFKELQLRSQRCEQC